MYTHDRFVTVLRTALSTFRAMLPKNRSALVALTLFMAAVLTFAFRADGFGFGMQQTAMLPEVTVEADRGDTLGYVVGEALERMDPLPVQEVDTETLWLARGIYSETKEPQEQELVAWTIRNRVETGYRGNRTYKEAVTDPYQFSAFNPGTRTRRLYTSLDATSPSAGFQNALAIARQVREADTTARPFSGKTRHFFSEQSMRGGRHPNWARGKSPVDPERPLALDAKRFRFYENVN